MPSIQEYIKRLRELRTISEEAYQRTLNNYATNYPDFYKQLMEAMSEKPANKSKLRLFFKEYKWYLTAISVGLIIIIILLYLLFNK